MRDRKVTSTSRCVMLNNMRARVCVTLLKFSNLNYVNAYEILSIGSGWRRISHVQSVMRVDFYNI